tara:strand:+ start:5507 stop:6178 length:672 start_codon:yes stop_codon:yes gene_type:complete
MCAIFGAKDRSMFDVLHDANLERGKYAFSCLFARDDQKHNIYKYEGHPDLHKIKNSDSHELFLGHNQAPTSAKRDYDKRTSHPFNSGNWIVAHNGVLSNFKQLKAKYFSGGYRNPVDSSIIPAMLDDLERTLKKTSEINIVKAILNRLEGTFGVWIYNQTTGNTYIARSGVTLFMNYKTKSFSSIRGKGFKEVKEGAIYKLTAVGGFKKMDEFETKSPFLTLS